MLEDFERLFLDDDRVSTFRRGSRILNGFLLRGGAEGLSALILGS